jgi:glycosyltransferase involved in cell wall biosynthesis
LRFPQYYNWFDVKIYKYKFNIACNEAEHIIAISECTKRDIMKFSGINSNMISVIYQGCDDSFKQPVSEEKKRDVRLFYGLPKRYILNVGSIEERKNVLLAIKALKYIPGDVSLVIVGKHTSYTNKILDYIEDNRLNSRVLILTDVPFSDLPAIYQMGEVFVYPSRYEGFGIPIIEAIHSGLPVVACTGSCLEEAGGPDSLYVSPDDYRGLSKALTSVLEGAPEREMRIKKSRSYVTKFDDKKVSEQVIREYDKLWWNRDV